MSPLSAVRENGDLNLRLLITSRKGAEKTNLLSIVRRRNGSLHSGSRIFMGTTTFSRKLVKSHAHSRRKEFATRGRESASTDSELPVWCSARCPRPRERPGDKSSVTMLTESVLTGMLDGRQRRESNGEGSGVQGAGGPGRVGRPDDSSVISLSLPVAPTFDMPGTTPNRYGRTWLRWGWQWTPTRRCPSVRERYWYGRVLVLAPRSI